MIGGWRGTGRPHGNARLDWPLVEEIKTMRGRFSASVVAEVYGIGKNTVLDIWNGKTWRVQ
jgi:hypothetical protein